MNPLEMIPDPNQPPIRTLSTLLTEEVNAESLSKVLIVDGVRITPGFMRFENAYEGKSFQNTMVIQNIGKHSALVRLGEATSQTFEFKPFVRTLPPGLRVTRTVSFTYNSTLGVLQSFAPIHVNDKMVDYFFIVTLSAAVLSLEPQQLNFGQIDAVNVVTTRTLLIKNSGYKGTQFAIDLGNNKLELIVEPMKGTIPAMSFVPIKIELVGGTEGEFAEEFWIKANPPLRVVVTGTFIEPKLVVRKFMSGLSLTLLDFQPTYYGSNSTLPLLIKNFSSSNSMFCVMAEIKGVTMTLDDARLVDDNYKNFIVKPIDGRIPALRGAVIQVTFSPVKTRKKEKNYAICFLKVIRINCRDTNHTDFQESVYDLKEASYSFASLSTLPSLNKDTYNVSDETIDTRQADVDVATSVSFEHGINVCVHGEKMEAGISFRPDTFTLKNLTLNEVHNRELFIKNTSTQLPIRVKYKKIVALEVVPSEFDLPPDGSKEVKVTLRCSKLTTVTKKITFDLLARDSPNDCDIFRTVGSASLKFSFDTNAMVIKSRLSKCVPCKESLPKLEPEHPHRFSPSELEKKIRNDSYYLTYIRRMRQVQVGTSKLLKDYDVSNRKLVLREEAKYQTTSKPPKAESSFTPFIPLAPHFLYNIKINPKSIRLRKVAAYTTITEYLQVENLNSFPICVCCRSSKPCIGFHNQEKHVIKSHGKKKISFIFSSNNVGRYYVNINVIVNDSALFEVTAVAQVLPKTLNVETASLVFEETDGAYKIFKVFNVLNTHTSFKWILPQGCFQVYPSKGELKAESFIYVMVTYTPDFAQNSCTECTLAAEDGQKKMMQISVSKRTHSVAFDVYEVNTGEIPLNVPIKKKIALKNLKNFQIVYHVRNQYPIPGVVVTPTDGILAGLDSQVFDITIHLRAPIEFSTNIVFVINDSQNISISLRGKVEYPRLSLKPEMLNFRKICPYSFDTLAFKIKNLSNCECAVAFPFEEIPEFTITDSEEVQFPHMENIFLLPQQSQILFLHFRPKHITTYTFFLPYIVNSIVGPMSISSRVSTNPYNFLQDKIDVYHNLGSVIAIKKIPTILPIVRINCWAVDKLVKFSCLDINFLYFGQDHYSNKTQTDFEVTNTSNNAIRLCIRIDDLIPKFKFEAKPGMNCVETKNVSFLVRLEPGNKIVFAAKFVPATASVGEYCVRLPIFIYNYHDEKIFNYLTLTGKYAVPTITPSQRGFCYEPVPHKLTSQIRMTLRMQNHFPNCEVSAYSELNGLAAIFAKGRQPAIGDSELAVYLTYMSVSNQCFKTTLIFHCTCKAHCEISVAGVAEVCLLTTHSFFQMRKSTFPGCDQLRKNSLYREEEVSSTSLVSPSFLDPEIYRNLTTYPFFPEAKDKSEYAVYMRSLQKTLENWLYSQGFYLKGYYRIPEGFSDFCKVGSPQKKTRFGRLQKSPIVELPLLQLIVNIAGEQIREHLAPRPPETDDELEWLVYTARVNDNVLQYLKKFPVSLPTSQAKFMLNYQQYVQHEKIKGCCYIPEDLFYRYSKQFWMDLILQLIKVFILFRMNTLPEQFADSMRHEETSVSLWGQTIGIYGDHEIQLIMWLEACFKKERITVWTSPDTRPPDKEIIVLDDDLRDGVILATVTAHYCPYIKDFIVHNIYTKPYTKVETFHNACTLVKVWNMLHLSYVISPVNLHTCHMVDMLLLVTYLYYVLPTCSPKNIITIQAPLTKTSQASIELENLGDDPIYYHAVFFGNERKLFTVTSSIIVVPPKKKKMVKLTYHAKSVETITSHLLFSGETPGHKYGKSMAIQLIGDADVAYACTQIPLNVKLYRPAKVNINIVSPFKLKADYNILFGYQPAFRNKNLLFAWEDVKHLNTIKELVLESDSYKFDENGCCASNPFVCCLSTIPRDIWLYFVNPEVGDWALQMTINAIVTEDSYEHIDVVLPKNYPNMPCRCKGKKEAIGNCPMLIHVRIPAKNNKLLNAAKAMVLRYVEGDELKFLSKWLYTTTGTRILMLLLNSETHPLRQQQLETVQYKIELDKHSPFVTLKSVTIDDIISEEFVDIPIHPLQDLLQVNNVVMRLVSHNGIETRFYRLFFKSGTEISSGNDKLKLR